jgi:hypothetical protein
MANRKLPGMLLLLAVSILSCKKEKHDEAPAVDKTLIVKLDNHLITVGEIDSANIVLRKGSSTPYFLRFQGGDKKLEALIDGLPTGNYSIDLELYSTSNATGKSYQFVSNRQVTIDNGNAAIQVEGPKELSTADGWSVRKIVATTGNDIVVLIPLDVNDPYFEIRTKGFQWDFFGVERLALDGSVVAAHKEWSCQNNCLGQDRMIFDKTIFLPFTDEIQQKNWTKNEIIITVGNIANQQYHEFTHVWNN